jgi:hypothetical protein
MWRIYTSLAASFRLWDEIENEVKACRCLADAAQKCVDILYGQLAESAPLIRVFATVRFHELSGFDRLKCIDQAAAHGVDRLLGSKTFVLSLLGTRGVQPGWNDRTKSHAHLSTPLVSSEFVESIPMIACLMKEMGIGVDWLDTQDAQIVVHQRGRTAGMFYVEDARTVTDARGRLVVPAQDFVEENKLKTVFGVGGVYPNGTFVSVVFFTRTVLTRADIERFIPLVHAFKAGTMNAVMAGNFFEASEPVAGGAAP